MFQGIRFQMDQNDHEGISIAGYRGEALCARLCVHFHDTKACFLPDAELEKAANVDGEAAVNEECSEYFSDVLRIDCLYLTKTEREKGIGSFLVRKAQNYADLRKFPLVVSAVPLARGLTGKPYIKNSVTQQDIRRLFWFFKKNGYKNRAVEFAMKKRMKLPEWIYKKVRDFYYIPPSLRKGAR